MQIKKQYENKFFERYEVEAELQGKITKKEVQEELGKKFNVSPELVVVNHIYYKFGCEDIDVDAFVYKNAEAFDKLKVKKKVKAKVEEKPEEKK